MATVENKKVEDVKVEEKSVAPGRGPGWGVIGIWVLVVGISVGVGVMGAGAIRKGVGKAAAVLGHEKEAAEGEAGHGEGFFTCGMHPWVIVKKDGDCPICHMRLTPVDPKKFTGEISIDPVMVQNMGVRTEAVIEGAVEQRLQTVGTVEYDTTRIRDTVVRVDGQIKKLYANAIGKPIEKGDPLVDFYSPEVAMAGNELVLAVKGGESVLIEAGKAKLRVMGVPEEAIEEMVREKKVKETFAIRSAISGVVMTKGGDEGHWLMQGEHVAEVVDLSKVWVMTTVYEYQLDMVEMGQKVVLKLPYGDKRSWEGKVGYIYPTLSEQRQVKLRIEVENPSATEAVLKPGMFVNVELKRELAGERVLVPREAVMDTGQRQIAFVSLGRGKFEPRKVKLGVDAQDGLVEVVEGVKAGEMVVTSGQFLLDSEARTREALAKMMVGTSAVEEAGVKKEEMEKEPAETTGGKTTGETMPAEVGQAMGKLLEAYLVIGDRLAGDSTKDVTEQAKEMERMAKELAGMKVDGNPHYWHEHAGMDEVAEAAKKLGEAGGIGQARERFVDVSVAMSRVLKSTGVPGEMKGTVSEYRCPMFGHDHAGAVWLQRQGEVRNPYFGKTMLECFDREMALKKAR